MSGSRTFVDVRFYVDPESSVTAEQVAKAIARGKRYSDLTPIKVKSYKLIDYGSELESGEVVRWHEEKERKN